MSIQCNEPSVNSGIGGTVGNGYGKRAIFLEAAKGTFSILFGTAVAGCYWWKFLMVS